MKNLELASPSEMSPVALVGEITAILASAIVRVLVADAPKQRAVGLGFLPDQRVHTTHYQEEKLWALPEIHF